MFTKKLLPLALGLALATSLVALAPSAGAHECLDYGCGSCPDDEATHVHVSYPWGPLPCASLPPIVCCFLP